MTLVRLMMLFSVILWGWSFVATKVALGFLSPIEVAGLRMIIGLPLLLLLVKIKRLNFNFTRKNWIVIIATSLVLTAHFIIQITGLVTTSATNTGWIISVTPAVIALLSVVILREKLTWFQTGGIAVATFGILLLVSRGDFSDLAWLQNKGDWLVLVSAFTWAIYTIMTRNLSRAHHPLLVTTAIMIPLTVIIVGDMTFTSNWGRFLRIPTEPLVAILFLGIFCQAAAFWFWQEGVARLGAARAGFFLYLEPLATTSLAVPYLGEELSFLAAMGGFLVLAGVYLTERRGNSK